MLVKLDLHPDRKQLRQFGFIALAAFGLLGGVVLWKGGLFGTSFGDSGPAVAYALWGVGVLSAIFSAVWPKANRPLFVALSVLAFPIGWALSHVVLAVMFYGVLTPVALLFRVIGRDPLTRKFEPDKKTYWVDLPEITEKKDYFRQF